MKHFAIASAALLWSSAALATQIVASTDNYQATAFFTSGLVDGESADKIDTAYLNGDAIVLNVDWDNMRTRAYRTEVRILDPNGRVVGTLRNVIRAGKHRSHTYYFYRPGPDDAPGDWTYQMYVDGRSAFEARIEVLASD